MPVRQVGVPASMCGRPFGFKGDAAESTTGTSAVMCPASRCGRHDRGPDGFRERALNTSAVSHSAVGCHGVSRSSVRPIATFCCRPFTRDASGSGDRRGTVCLTAGHHGPHDTTAVRLADQAESNDICRVECRGTGSTWPWAVRSRSMGRRCNMVARINRANWVMLVMMVCAS